MSKSRHYYVEYEGRRPNRRAIDVQCVVKAFQEQEERDERRQRIPGQIGSALMPHEYEIEPIDIPTSPPLTQPVIEHGWNINGEYI